MSEHTPGPWEVGGPYPSVSVIVCIDAGCGWPNPEPSAYEAICILDQRTEGVPSEQAVANAEFIVRACNAHEDLVAALKAAKHLPTLSVFANEQSDSHYHGAKRAAEYAAKELVVLKQIDAALAKATGDSRKGK